MRYIHWARTRLLALVIFGWCSSAIAQDAGPSLDQQLIVACYRLQIREVSQLLRKGANVNAVMGRSADRSAFHDGWTAKVAHVGSTRWTPLMAVAASPSDPPPPRDYKPEERWFKPTHEHVPTPDEQLAAREAAAVAIVFMLYSHNCDLERDDGRGATALYLAAERRRTDVLRELLRYGAKPNIKVRPYFDKTPLHNATHSPEAMQLLLDHGADPEARDTDGHTPSDWLEWGSKGHRLVKTANGWKLQAETSPRQ
jgi:ankyrin repeat protein